MVGQPVISWMDTAVFVVLFVTTSTPAYLNELLVSHMPSRQYRQ